MNPLYILLAVIVGIQAMPQPDQMPPLGKMHKCGVSCCSFSCVYTPLTMFFKQKCIRDVYDIAKKPSGPIDCPALDSTCLCSKVNFWYGIRDCSQNACGKDVYNQVAEWKDNVLCAMPSVPDGSLESPASSTAKTPSSQTAKQGVTTLPQGDFYTYQDGDGKTVTVSL
jgi:CFEM domain